MKQFVEISDDVLYRAEGLPGPLVPYHCGVFCWHQLREEVTTRAPENVLSLAIGNRAGESVAVNG